MASLNFQKPSSPPTFATAMPASCVKVDCGCHLFACGSNSYACTQQRAGSCTEMPALGTSLTVALDGGRRSGSLHCDSEARLASLSLYTFSSNMDTARKQGSLAWPAHILKQIIFTDVDLSQPSACVFQMFAYHVVQMSTQGHPSIPRTQEVPQLAGRKRWWHCDLQTPDNARGLFCASWARVKLACAICYLESASTRPVRDTHARTDTD